MKLDQLKKGFFGYKKASVYEYISLMDEEFSAKLLEKEAEYRKGEEQYRERIIALEEELNQVRDQLEQQRKEQMTIASTLMEATRYGESLRQAAQAREQKEREAWEKKLAENEKEINKYHEQIKSVREMFGSLLRAMDEQIQTVEQKAEAVKSSCPSHNMTLFERKNDAEE